VEKEMAQRREIEIGVQGPRATEVLRGLAAGEAVILAPPEHLRPGQAVRLQAAAAPLAGSQGSGGGR
jgi:hypothetical protein